MTSAPQTGGGLFHVSMPEDHKHQIKAEIANHHLYQHLLSAHVSCLRVASPIDQIPLIDAQLSQSHLLLRSYARNSLSQQQTLDLDTFLEEYLVVLCSLRDQLQKHVRVDAVEAVMACREIEHRLHSLTGATLGEGTGLAMSDDEDEMHTDFSTADVHDLMGFDPLLLTDSERTLMERVRQELKIELQQGFDPLLLTDSERTLMERVRQELKIELQQAFKSKIEDVREEILRKRRAGKLPGDTTTVLKNWWHQHSKWPYPTEEDKVKLVEQTGLQLKQINNWFINQRKRNWNSSLQSPTCLKSKRKREM